MMAQESTTDKINIWDPIRTEYVKWVKYLKGKAGFYGKALLSYSRRNDE